MKLNKRKGTTVVISLLVVVIILSIWWNELGTLFSPGSYKDIDRMVETMMDKSATPGVAIVTSKQGEIEYKSYGYADVKNNIKVNEESLFELASTTKAFTALAILLLEEDGLINGSDLITDYISWFTPSYQDEQVSITIDQLLSHTSGIPSCSIRLIPEGTSSDLLEKTVHNIATISLNTSPGAQYHYATINYDVLALIIEKVTGESYQEFVTDYILIPIGMNDSYFSTGTEPVSDQLTKGYKYSFGKSIEYDAPRYYGNMAAGYLVTNAKDLGYWINAQLGMGDIPDKLRNAIVKSHEVNQTTAGYVESNIYYSYGWSKEITDEVISHSGANPNYSSQVIIDLKKQEAVFVLANLNSTVATQIASSIYNDMNGLNMSKYSYDDYYKIIDYIFSILSFITLVMLCVKIIKSKFANRNNQNNNLVVMKSEMRIRISLILRIIIMVLILIWPYLLNYNYDFIRVWMSNAILVWQVLSVFSCVVSIITKAISIIEIRRRGSNL